MASSKWRTGLFALLRTLKVSLITDNIGFLPIAKSHFKDTRWFIGGAGELMFLICWNPDFISRFEIRNCVFTCTRAPSSSTIHSSARPVCDWRLNRWPGFKVVRLTVLSWLKAYCLNLPQGRSAKSTGGFFSGMGLAQ
jgi:hypothetical protein